MDIDILVDVQFGDCGKGKISKWLVEENNYWAVAKYNGGPNAGHAVWVDGKKHTAHMLTSGVYDPKVKVIIGPGCVINVEKFLKELDLFESFNIKDRVFIHPNTHIITEKHITQDGKDSTIGTTKQGIGPVYADKMLRVGIRAREVEELKPFILHHGLLGSPTANGVNSKILMEGSQGWWLDIDNGYYPYVTSSNIHPAHALSTFGLPHQDLHRVYGVGKVYETYVGNSDNLVVSSKKDADVIRKVGGEYGETTGRPRKIGYINVPRLIRAVNSTGVDVLFLNKLDILEEVGIFKAFIDDESTAENFNNVDDFTEAISNKLYRNCRYLRDIIFSGNKETV